MKNKEFNERDDEEGGSDGSSDGHRQSNLTSQKQGRVIDQDEDEGSSGKGSGTVYHYIDPSSQIQRDDFLKPEELQRLIAVHQGIHKERVNKQKITRKEREMIKEGSRNLISAAYDNSRGFGMGANANSQFLPHPYAYKFSGIRDMEVSIFPSENIPDTNKNEYQNRLDLQNKNELRNRNELRYRNTPKPKPF